MMRILLGTALTAFLVGIAQAEPQSGDSLPGMSMPGTGTMMHGQQRQPSAQAQPAQGMGGVMGGMMMGCPMMQMMAAMSQRFFQDDKAPASRGEQTKRR
jgi:hypothetical protein